MERERHSHRVAACDQVQLLAGCRRHHRRRIVFFDLPSDACETVFAEVTVAAADCAGQLTGFGLKTRYLVSASSSLDQLSGEVLLERKEKSNLLRNPTVNSACWMLRCEEDSLGDLWS